MEGESRGKGGCEAANGWKKYWSFSLWHSNFPGSSFKINIRKNLEKSTKSKFTIWQMSDILQNLHGKAEMDENSWKFTCFYVVNK